MNETKEVEIIAYKVPLIDKGNTSVGATLTRDEIEAAPTRDVRSVASQAAGVFQKDDGDDVNVEEVLVPTELTITWMVSVFADLIVYLNRVLNKLL